MSILQKEIKYHNKEYDEGIEVSQDFSVADSFDGRNEAKSFPNNKEKQFKNEQYDEAIELSQSNVESFNVAAPKIQTHVQPDISAKELHSGATSNSKSTSVRDKHHDEEVDLSNSGSDESVDTRHSANDRHRGSRGHGHHQDNRMDDRPTPMTNTNASANAAGKLQTQQPTPSYASSQPSNIEKKPVHAEESSSEEENDGMLYIVYTLCTI